MATVGKGGARDFARAEWDLLYRRHCSGVISYVRRTFGAGPPDPEDVAHAVISKLAMSGGAGGVDNTGAYLRRMAHNFVLETHRREKTSERNLGELKILNGESADFTPEDIIASKQELSRLDAALAELKPKQRVALLLHRVDGLSFTDVGRELGMSRNGAKQLIEAAHKACMAAMRRGER